MTKKKNIYDLIQELVKSGKQVSMGDVAQTVFMSLDFLNENSPSFKAAKKADEKAYNGMVNTILLTLAANLSTMGMGKEETVRFMESLDTSGISSMGMVIVRKKTPPNEA